MRFKTVIGLLIVVFTMALIVSPGITKDEKTKSKETITCPVSGEIVAKSDAVGPFTYKGQEYYFCCSNCLEKFKAEPEKYINKVITICCNGMRMDKDAAIKVEYKGNGYYFCSAQHKAEFDKDPDAYLKKVNAKKMEHHKNCDGKKDKAKHGKKCCHDE